MFTWHMYLKIDEKTLRPLRTISRTASPTVTRSIQLRIDGMPTTYIIREVSCSKNGEYTVIVTPPNPEGAIPREFEPRKSTKATTNGI